MKYCTYRTTFLCRSRPAMQSIDRQHRQSAPAIGSGGAAGVKRGLYVQDRRGCCRIAIASHAADCSTTCNRCTTIRRNGYEMKQLLKCQLISKNLTYFTLLSWSYLGPLISLGLAGGRPDYTPLVCHSALSSPHALPSFCCATTPRTRALHRGEAGHHRAFQGTVH